MSQVFVYISPEVRSISSEDGVGIFGGSPDILQGYLLYPGGWSVNTFLGYLTIHRGPLEVLGGYLRILRGYRVHIL